MSLFKQFATDEAKEVNGVHVEYAANEDGSVPTFIIRRQGKTNKAYSKALEKAMRPFQRQMQLNTLPEEQARKILLEVFCNTVIVGWFNVFNRDGDEMMFTAENAIQLFEALPELYDDLSSKASSAAMFVDDEQEQNAKN